MSEYQPVATMDDLKNLDSDEMVEGYRSGLSCEPEPGSAKSRSFWHGWRNGMMDRGKLPHDDAANALVREMGAKSRANGMH